MKRGTQPLAVLALCLLTLTACGAITGSAPDPGGAAPAASPSPAGDAPADAGKTAPPAAGAAVVCRVVDEDDGALLLAEVDGPGVYSISVRGVEPTLDGKSTALIDLDYDEGSLVEITHSGNVRETFPAQLDVLGVDLRAAGFDDRCALYLDVLEDLWETDPALNDGITELGVDLSQTSLSESERAAVAWAFGQEHGIVPIQGTWEELAEQGYIDRAELYWADGCLFSIAEQEMEGAYSLTPVTFDAQKWRSGLGAYFLTDCTALQSAGGEWSDYVVGSQAVA